MVPVSDPDLPLLEEEEHPQCPEALLYLAAGSVLSVLPCPPSAPVFLSRARSIPTRSTTSAAFPTLTYSSASLTSTLTRASTDSVSTSTSAVSSQSPASSTTTSSSTSSSLSSSSSLPSLTRSTGCTDTISKQLQRAQGYEMQESRDDQHEEEEEKTAAAADVNDQPRHHHAASSSFPPARILTQPGLIHFLRSICAHAKVSELALVISLIYVDRLKKVLLTSMARGDPDTPFKIILSALLVVKKFLDEDSFGLNRLFSRITLYTLSDINTMERSFLGLLKYSLFVTEEEVAQFLLCHEQELHGLDILKTSIRSAIVA